jgi:hypothetical protein
MNLLEQGRRYLHVSDLPSAIGVLSESVKLLVKQYGENADECTESFYYLGMAFHEKHRADSCELDEPFTFTIRPLSLPSGDKSEEEDGESEDEENGDEEESGEEDVGEKSTNGDVETSKKADKPDDSEVKEKTKVANDEKSTTEIAEHKPETVEPAASEAVTVAKAEDVETKKSEPSSEHTNRNNSESKAEVKTDAAQNEKKNLSKQMTNLRRLLAVLQETKLILWAMMMMMYVCILKFIYRTFSYNNNTFK